MEHGVTVLEYDDFSFPNPRETKGLYGGIVAIGGDLEPDRILEAYKRGIFPWYGDDSPIFWWSPDPRLVLYPEEFKITKSFRRVLRNGKYKVTFDGAFERVLHYCSKVPRRGQDGTWLNGDMKRAYIQLHKRGYAHSVEVWMDELLVGGLYGVAIGGAFFGESMFALRSNASKIALKAISDVLNKNGYDFIDCQVTTSHLLSLGAVEVSKMEFLDALDVAIKKELNDIGSWSNLKWEYSDGR